MLNLIDCTSLKSASTIAFALLIVFEIDVFTLFNISSKLKLAVVRFLFSLIIKIFIKSFKVSWSNVVDCVNPAMSRCVLLSAILLVSINLQTESKFVSGALRLCVVMYPNCFSSLLLWISSLISCSRSSSAFLLSVTSLCMETQWVIVPDLFATGKTETLAQNC